MGLRARGLAALLGLGFAACGDDDGADDDRAVAPAALEGGEAEEDQPAAATTATMKRQAYLAQWTQCLHRTASRVRQAWRRYGLTVDAEEGTPLDKGKAPFIYRVSGELEACRNLDMPPEGTDLVLPSVGKAYVEATATFAGLSRDLAAYYEAKAYEGDDWAKGKETAPTFRATYDAWVEQHGKFVAALDKARGVADQARLEELEAAGEQGLRWRVARLTLWGRTISACIAREETPDKACAGSANDFQEVQAELDEFCRKNPADAVGVFWLDVLRAKASDLSDAVKAATAPPPKKRRTAPEGPDAKRAGVQEAFRELEVASDRVRFDFP